MANEITSNEGAMENVEIQTINGEEVCVLTNELGQFIINQPANGVSQNVELVQRQNYMLNFDPNDVVSSYMQDSNLVINFADSSLVLENYDVNGATDGAYQITMANGRVIEYGTLVDALTANNNQPSENLLEATEEVSIVDEIVELEEIAVEESAEDEMVTAAVQLASVEPAAGEEAPVNALIEELAAIEPAAGAAAGGGNSGYGFNSSFTPTTPDGIDDIGPIGPTALNYVIPAFQDDVQGVARQSIPGAAFEVPDALIFEDNPTATPVDFDIVPVNADGVMTVTISNIPSDWTVTGYGNFDPATGVWTYVTTPGQSLDGGPVFTPPLHSDVDLVQLPLTVSETSATNGTLPTLETFFTIFVDAVADGPAIAANDSTDVEDAVQDISAAVRLIDTDGSETIDQTVTLTVDSRFTILDGNGSALAFVDNGNGTYSYTVTVGTTPGVTYNANGNVSLSALDIKPPAGFVGDVDVVIQAGTTESNPTDFELRASDADNNNAADTETFTVTWTPAPLDPPIIKVTDPDGDLVGTGTNAGAQVKEDNTIVLDVVAELPATAKTGDYLTVTITGIDTAWAGDVTFPAGGTFSAGGTVWTYVVPADQNFSGEILVAPDADRDIDLTGLEASATVTRGVETADSTPQAFDVIVDAVADDAVVVADNNSGQENDVLAVNISKALTGEENNAILNGGTAADADGSEAITGYQVSGLQAGFTFVDNNGNAIGTLNGNGSYDFTPAEMAVLNVKPAAGFVGSITLNVTMFTIDNPTDGEFDNSAADNTDQASDPLVLSWTALPLDPPTITVTEPNGDLVGTGVSDGALVKEDNTIVLDVVAELPATAQTGDFLTVTITGIDTAWAGDVTFPAGGTFSAGGTVWTYVVPADQNFSGEILVAPDADRDIDLTGMEASVTVTRGSDSVSGTPQDFDVIVDAVADDAVVVAQDDSGEEGDILDVDLTTTLTGEENNAILNGGTAADADGSEVITEYQVSGLQPGFTFVDNNGNAIGSLNPNGSYSFTTAEMAVLRVQPPAGFVGKLDLSVTMFTIDNPTDGEFDNSAADNTDEATDTLTLTWVADDIPQIVSKDTLTTDDSDLAAAQLDTDSGRLVVDFGSDAPGSFALVGGSFTDSIYSNGDLVSVTTVGNRYVGTAGGETVFEFILNESTGAYEFKQYKNLDHGNTNSHNEALPLSFRVRITDSDGSTIVTDINVNVLDDGPDAQDDTGTVSSGGDQVTGNVLANDNGGEDVEDGNNGTNPAIIQVNGQNVTFVNGVATINGSYGVLELAENGDFTYTKDSSVTTNETDSFTYTIVDGDGDTDTASLNINIQALPDGRFIVGENVDDNSGSNTPYEVGTGNGVINGSAGQDILVGDSGGSNEVIYPKCHNLLFLIDNSTSMGNVNVPTSNFRIQMEAIIDMVKDIAYNYTEGLVRARFQPFNTDAGAAVTFEINDVSDFYDAIAWLENLQAGGVGQQTTNYEAALQAGIDWLQSDEPFEGYEAQTFIISDGGPNTYVDANGNNVVGSADQVVDEITGVSDGTNEIAILQSLSTVHGVGINAVGNEGIDEIALIDSDGIVQDIQVANVYFEDPVIDYYLDPTKPVVNRLEAAGDDVINGGAANDIIFGDALYTETLAADQGFDLPNGAGWEVFARLENGEGNDAGWTRADTLDYIRNNIAELSQESVDETGTGRDGGNDILNGGNGDDAILGQEGNDVITGGNGDDILSGGSGADVFVFKAGETGTDSITDFDLSEGDYLDISDMLSGFDPLNDDIAEFVSVREEGGNTIVSVDADGAGSGAAVDIATLFGSTGLGTQLVDLVNNGEAYKDAA